MYELQLRQLVTYDILIKSVYRLTLYCVLHESKTETQFFYKQVGSPGILSWLSLIADELYLDRYVGELVMEQVFIHIQHNCKLLQC